MKIKNISETTTPDLPTIVTEVGKKVFIYSFKKGENVGQAISDMIDKFFNK